MNDKEHDAQTCGPNQTTYLRTLFAKANVLESLGVRQQLASNSLEYFICDVSHAALLTVSH